MQTKLIPSTEAQNNFGRILDDVVQQKARYIVQRRGSPQAIIMSIADFEALLAAAETERQSFGKILREIGPTYSLGSPIGDEGE
jgi:prevent-host-death family protein